MALINITPGSGLQTERGTTGNAVVTIDEGKNLTLAAQAGIDYTIAISRDAVVNPGGSNGQVQFNDNGVLNGADGITYDKVQDVTTVTNFTSTGVVDLGIVSNIHIYGGSANAVLTTDGSGNLTWGTGSGPATAVPYIHFDVVSAGRNQTFTNANLSLYASNLEATVFKNGVLISPDYYTLVGNTITVLAYLNIDDNLDVSSRA